MNMEATTRSSRRRPGNSKLLERLARLEHEQWTHYSRDVSEQIMHANSLEDLQLLIKEKWSPNWVDYFSLSEEEKEKDRIWARKVLKVIGTYSDVKA
jgi:hypothetical protein